VFAYEAPLEPATDSVPAINIEERAGLWLIGDWYTFGSRATVLGDLNDDLLDDLLIVTQDRGGGYGDVFLGNSELGGVLVIATDSSVHIGTDSYCLRVQAVGDFNGDSLADISVSGHHPGWGPSDAYLLLGKSVTPRAYWTVPADADITLVDATDSCVYTARYHGDLNGDGFDDLGIMTGSYFANQPERVLLGRPDPPTVIDVADAEISLQYDFFAGGLNVRYYYPASDVNGDGCDELLMYGRNLADDYEGRIWLGDPALTTPLNITAADAQILLVPRYPDREATFRTLPDINGDGIGDIAYWQSDSPHELPKEGCVVFGEAGRDARITDFSYPDLTFAASDPGHIGVLHIYAAGDADGDGISDVFVREIPGTNWYIFRGSPSLQGTIQLSSAIARTPSEYWVVDGTGDLNGNGFDDFIFHDTFNDEYAVIFGPLLQPNCLQAANAAGIPGEEDVPVRVYLQSPASVDMWGIIFKLHYDDSMLLPPAEEDVTCAVPGMVWVVDTSIPGQVVVGLISASGVDVAIPPKQDFATVLFDVDPGVAFGTTSDLTVEIVEALHDDYTPVDIVAGPPGVFSVYGIYPMNPEVYLEEYVHFTTALEGTPLWSLVAAPSGGTIDQDTGVYQAGETGGTIDEVTVVVDPDVITTGVTVLDGQRPSGVAGPPTSMDVDGGGVGLSDVLRTIRYVVGLGAMNPQQQEAADFGADGEVGLDDCINTLRVVVGLPPISP